MGLKITQEAHNKLINLVVAIQEKQRDFTTFIDKLENIDKAYAKHEIELDSLGEDQPKEKAIKVPVVNSEIDDITAYLTSIFINQIPLFPVMAEKGKPEEAMMLQTLISRDAKHQRWGRQLLKFMSAAARYNVAAIEVEKIEEKSIKVDTAEDVTKFDLISGKQPATKLKAVDMYNALFDYRYDPADIAFEGEHAGYNEIISKTALKRLGTAYAEAGTAYNLKEAYASDMAGTEMYWNERPDISDVIPESATDKGDWLDWIGITESEVGKMKMAFSSYFITRLYIRIIPSEFGINIKGGSSTPTIIKLTIVNNKWIINWQEVITPLEALPMLFCDTREDGFGYQTKSAGENVLPYQQTATELLNTRLKTSKRALNDRAIFDPAFLDYQKINSANPSAKIPIKQRLKNSGERPPLNTIYYQIPFESSGTVGAISDMREVLQIKDQVNGNNFAFRGEQKKGNRTLGEFDTLNERAEGKALPTAIRIEEQVMIPLKLMIKINILTTSIIDEKVLNEEAGEVVNINIPKLREAMIGFKVTDGLKPKEAIRDPEVLSTAIQFIQNNEALNIEYEIGGIFSDLMAQLNVDISKHKRKQPLNGNPTGQPNAANTADAGADQGTTQNPV